MLTTRAHDDLEAEARESVADWLPCGSRHTIVATYPIHVNAPVHPMNRLSPELSCKTSFVGESGISSALLVVAGTIGAFVKSAT